MRQQCLKFVQKEAEKAFIVPVASENPVRDHTYSGSAFALS